MTNCMGGVSFALKDIGIPSSALQWYGSVGEIRWLNDHAKADAEKYFEIIKIKTKTFAQCYKDGTILPGDVLTYMEMAHANLYLGQGTSFDTGHAYCKGSGEGAEFTKWVGLSPYQNKKIAYIIRLKNKANKYIYRVQLGAYTEKKNASRRVTAVKKASGFDGFVEQGSDGWYRVFCGSFEQKANAENRIRELSESGVKDAVIKAVRV